MRYILFFLILFCTLPFQGAFAANSSIPNGDILFHNQSNTDITASISQFGSITLDKKESKEIPYQILYQVCSENPDHCKANFYINKQWIGYASFNVSRGKITSMHLNRFKVSTRQRNHIVRDVIIS